jgi:hypothetical protein
VVNTRDGKKIIIREVIPEPMDEQDINNLVTRLNREGLVTNPQRLRREIERWFGEAPPEFSGGLPSGKGSITGWINESEVSGEPELNGIKWIDNEMM